MAREVALQYLYQVDITSRHTLEGLSLFLTHFVEDEEIVPYARELVVGVYDNLERIDALLDRASNNWSVSRMTVTDRNVLRIATYELLCCSDVPFKVAINEAVELGKRFGSPKFPAFANGVLDRVRTEVA